MVNTPSYEQKTEMQYDRFIKVALDNEFKGFLREMADELYNLSLFSELEDGQVENFTDDFVLEAFNNVDADFQVLQYTVEVRDAVLYDALSQLDAEFRNIVLLRHWLGMTDQEIADETGMERRNVTKKRAKAHKKLKDILEADGYDANSFFPKHEA
jgi:RNA polymerase sigma factor (sigma-70 family)